MRYVVWWQLLKHVIGNPEDDALSGLARASATVLGLDVHDGVQHLLCHVALEPGVRVRVSLMSLQFTLHRLQQVSIIWLCSPNSRDVSIGVQAEDLRGVHQREVVNGLPELLNGFALRNAVAFVEGKRL